MIDTQIMPAPRILDEIQLRRTFAIISHPDAGKTTLTEKLLLYGNAVHLAGSVRARRNQRHTTSDWMEIERQRGISITSTVLQFPYRGCTINLLDTPGHEDFSEDTYRTLAAVDSAVMVIDAAKGIEEQTRKLFQVCRKRGIPIFTFINKMDRPGREPLELLDEIESVLGMQTLPMNWPIGQGPTFQGVYDRQTRTVHLFERSEGGQKAAQVEVSDLADPALLDLLGVQRYDALRAEIELLDGAGTEFDAERFSRGEISPVFFGSALTNFGVQLFLDHFVDMAPTPGVHQSERGPVSADAPFSGFVFKIQANMNPQHRDSVAFVRVCSGRFERDMQVYHARLGQKIRLARSLKFFAQAREVVDEAYAGDVIGLVNPGLFMIGDSVSADQRVTYQAVPRFDPEHFAVVRNTNTAKYKQFQRGLQQLEGEGAIQVLYSSSLARSEPILAAVGRLQFDVVRSRLENEYGVLTSIEPLDWRFARWLAGTPEAIVALPWGQSLSRAEDSNGNPVALISSAYTLRYLQENFPNVQLRASMD